MNFSTISNQSLAGKLLRLPLSFLPRNVKIPILQGKLKGKSWIVGSSVHGCWLGSYEYEQRILFERVIKQGSIVYDIGAHVGFYTLLASVLVGPTGKVLAFEPNPRNLSYLKAHLEINNIGNVLIFEKAVSNKTGTSHFEAGGGHSSMGHLAESGELQVETVALDELVASNGIPLPNYIKIDVEGAEFDALSGARKLLSCTRPVIFLSIHGDKAYMSCKRLLEDLGYLLRPIHGESEYLPSELLCLPKS